MTRMAIHTRSRTIRKVQTAPNRPRAGVPKPPAKPQACDHTRHNVAVLFGYGVTVCLCNNTARFDLHASAPGARKARRGMTLSPRSGLSAGASFERRIHTQRWRTLLCWGVLDLTGKDSTARTHMEGPALAIVLESGQSLEKSVRPFLGRERM